ncbi:MAG: SDR family oxidoreductase [Bosea sp.]|uniref:SDR family oxidoreductase n=1 Tax=unclassified Bosea (in: a-proteobacteria) TaxID=2653178 RepID=UPI000960C23B|nr:MULTISPECIES: SDR family oxidoreductase [unclassified Bosea (in: a-proteobacteria)]MBN9458116.1 SDR family oxidoreductase [Bosea sp. (in: a-proteobacteria)]OJV10615.1 MAG: 3-beta hydroxysteroid dehydrogenase [Bosea sp. 67-29]
MHVFVTGATGWVGSAVVADFLRAGHRVTALARTTEKASALAADGVEIVPGTLDDLDVLQSAAARADGVIHTAFNHDFLKDFSLFATNAAQDERAIIALGQALAGSDRPILVTSGLSGLQPGATEADRPVSGSPRRSEAAATALAEHGVRAATIRLAPSVHGIGDYGFVAMLARLARETGVSAYIGDGSNCWSGVHRLDAAKVYRLALERGATEAIYHAVADEAVPFREIAAAIGRRLGLPVEARPREHFGGFAMMVAASMAATSEATRSRLGWEPSGPGLIAELDRADYYAA